MALDFKLDIPDMSIMKNAFIPEDILTSLEVAFPKSSLNQTEIEHLYKLEKGSGLPSSILTSVGSLKLDYYLITYLFLSFNAYTHEVEYVASILTQSQLESLLHNRVLELRPTITEFIQRNPRNFKHDVIEGIYRLAKHRKKLIAERIELFSNIKDVAIMSLASGVTEEYELLALRTNGSASALQKEKVEFTKYLADPTLEKEIWRNYDNPSKINDLQIDIVTSAKNNQRGISEILLDYREAFFRFVICIWIKKEILQK